jgi:tRNA (guanine-N7-)-methyltransferase
VDPAHPLLEPVWVPRNVVVDHQVAELEVDPLPRSLRSDHDLGALAKAFFSGNSIAQLDAAVDDGDLANVRIWDEDATQLLAAIPDASLARVYLLYPDPWPKRRQRKRRFVSDETLAEIARVLKPGGVFRFASDIDDYAGWTLVRAARCDALDWTAEAAADWTRPFPEWPGTRYEAKAIAAGRGPTYLEFRRLG